MEVLENFDNYTFEQCSTGKTEFKNEILKED